MAQVAWEYFGGSSGQGNAISFASPVVYSDYDSEICAQEYYRNTARFFHEDDPAPILLQKLRGGWLTRPFGAPLRHGQPGYEIHDVTRRRRYFYSIPKDYQVRVPDHCSEPEAPWTLSYSFMSILWYQAHGMEGNYLHNDMCDPVEECGKQGW